MTRCSGECIESLFFNILCHFFHQPSVFLKTIKFVCEIIAKFVSFVKPMTFHLIRKQFNKQAIAFLSTPSCKTLSGQLSSQLLKIQQKNEKHWRAQQYRVPLQLRTGIRVREVVAPFIASCFLSVALNVHENISSFSWPERCMKTTVYAV